MGTASVTTLKQTTYSGRKFTRKELEDVQETVLTCKNLSRKELARTLCEHLRWKSPNGALKIDSCYKLLDAMEKSGVIDPLERRQTQPRPRREAKADPSLFEPPIETTLEELGPLELRLAQTSTERYLWQAYMQQHHYLGFRQAFGTHLRYFIVASALQRNVGCLLFSASAAYAMEARDRWIGWRQKAPKRLRDLVLSNDRFLILPWVKVPNLASAALSLAVKQVAKDWPHFFGYQPVLIETFVDPTRYSGTCYKAANWKLVGQTKGRGARDPKHLASQTIKDIYMYELDSNWRQILNEDSMVKAKRKKYRCDLAAANTRAMDEDFILLWEKVAHIVAEAAAECDGQWRRRERLIGSMLLIMLIFRLVCSKDKQSYGAAIDELWDSCRNLKMPLPQPESIAPSSFCDARQKMPEEVFRLLNQRIVALDQSRQPNDSDLWHGHRMFAVDGSKINLPSQLLDFGYQRPTKDAHYPQGMISCLYLLRRKIPFDFDLVAHANERECAKKYLEILKPGDIVVYDRGYFSYEMLYLHVQKGIHAIFRLQDSNCTAIEQFAASSETDKVVSICPASTVRNDLSRKHPQIKVAPLPIRLLKYQAGTETFCLGTTLTDQERYPNLKDFSDAYHERWGVEELYKISKRLFAIEEFHAQTERGVRQEVFAHFVLITMNRLFALQADEAVNESSGPSAQAGDLGATSSADKPPGPFRTSFRNCLRAFSRNLEALILVQAEIKLAVKRLFASLIRRHQRERPGRSYPRQSFKPASKWSPRYSYAKIHQAREANLQTLAVERL